MLSLRFRCLALGLVLGLGLRGAGVCGPKVEKTQRYARDHLIVKFRKRARGSGLRALNVKVRGTVARTFRSSGATLIKLARGEDVDKIIAQVRADPSVEYAERDHYLRVHRNVPNDPDFDSCWALDNQGQTLGTPDADIDAPEAWDVQTGSAAVVVAVIDTGVDHDHSDLAANMWTNQAELTGAPGVDDDGNGYTDDVHGISVINAQVTGDTDDDHGHGTHVAGIIGAAGNNGRGIVGVNWTVRIMALNLSRLRRGLPPPELSTVSCRSSGGLIQ